MIYFLNNLIKFCVVLTCFIYNISSFSHDYYFGELTIGHPYIFETMPGSKVAAGYLTITNTDVKSEFLVGGETTFSNKMEIHRMEMEEGIMKMKSLKNGLEIPPKKSIKLEPKNYHIMFMGLNKKLIKNTKEKVLLVFKKTGEIIVDFNIESMADKNKKNKLKHSSHDKN